MPTPQQRPGDPTPDINLILTQIAAEHQSEANTATPAETEKVPTETPGPTATPQKKETLTVCLGKEPQTLFFYAESSQAMWSVLESIYNGPFDKQNGESIPVIFDDISVKTEPITIVQGDVIVDFDGDPVEMKTGTVFMPANPQTDCSGTSCLSTWFYNSTQAEMLQTVITFRLKDDLFWNDGTPLTAEDSVYSMSVNGMKGINASKRIYNLTESYTALDEHTVEWRGLPGYQPDDPSEVFWIPLPGHVMKGMSVEDILSSEQINQSPLGWGAWQITSWNKGNEIIAERNPYYSNESAPFFDRIVYKFYGRAGDNSLEALHSGTCDIIDTSVDLGADLEPILEDVDKGKETIYIRPEMTRQELVFNLEPAVQQWVISPLTVLELRTVIAQGINRNAINRQVFYGQSEIPVDFYPAEHINHNAELKMIEYDPDAAKEALDAMGWTVSEDDPDGARIAAKVPGVIYGTKLTFKLTYADSTFSRKTAAMIEEDLAEIGILLETEPLSLGELYAQGPEGVTFGRKFDTVMFAWAAGNAPCAIYLSDQIPNEINHWVGTNVGSYRNEDFDQACLLPEFSDLDPRQIYAEELPAIPLYFNISVAVSANNICGISDTIGSRSILWNVEQFSRSETNCAVSQWNDIYHQ
ncbi:MAG: hypothetical protein IJI41_00895 [Anaerolineaceae bacterium]|nr:hypothetical protein [Anaerolineaceae bacterium]